MYSFLTVQEKEKRMILSITGQDNIAMSQKK